MELKSRKKNEATPEPPKSESPKQQSESSEEKTSQQVAQDRLNDLFNDSLQFQLSDLWYSEGFRPTFALFVICALIYFFMYSYFHTKDHCHELLALGDLNYETMSLMDEMLIFDIKAEEEEFEYFKAKGSEALQLYTQVKARLKKECPRGKVKITAAVSDIKSSKTKNYERKGIAMTEMTELSKGQVKFSCRGKELLFLDCDSSVSDQWSGLVEGVALSNISQVIGCTKAESLQKDFFGTKLKLVLLFYSPHYFEDFLDNFKIEGTTLHISHSAKADERIPIMSRLDLGKIVAKSIHTKNLLQDLSNKKSKEILSITSQWTTPNEIVEVFKQTKLFEKVEYHPIEAAASHKPAPWKNEQFIEAQMNTAQFLGKSPLSLQDWSDSFAKEFLSKHQSIVGH